MDTYIGVKMIKAEPEVKNGQPGYAVEYPDGYRSWSPEDAFESAYLKACDTTVSDEMVQSMIADIDVSTLNAKTTLVEVDTLTGFNMVGVSSCVDPANYDEKVGAELALEEIESKLWGHLGFVLQWAKYGLKT